MDPGSFAAGGTSTVESNALLKDLLEKKQNLRRIASEVGAMASELREVRGRMSVQEAALQQETSRRQSAESQVRTLEEELGAVRKHLEEQSSHALSTASVAEQYLKELVDVRAKLESAQQHSDTSYASATIAQLGCETLLKDIETRNQVLQENEVRASKLGQQVVELQHELRLREASEKQLNDEVGRLETQMGKEVANATSIKDLEVRRFLEEATARNAQPLAKQLSSKDEEIAYLREEIKVLSAQLKQKNTEYESQIERHRVADQDLKKRIIKLEFWLHEARAQARKLQRVAERREKEIKEHNAQLASGNDSLAKPVNGFLGSSRFKIVISVSVVALFLFAKR